MVVVVASIDEVTVVPAVTVVTAVPTTCLLGKMPSGIELLLLGAALKMKASITLKQDRVLMLCKFASEVESTRRKWHSRNGSQGLHCTASSPNGAADEVD